MESATQRKKEIYRVTGVGMVVNIVLTIFKLIAGIIGRSGAIVADAIHSLSDLATDLVVLGFARISTKPNDANHNYGHGKYETLATILISLALLGVGVGILLQSIHNIRSVIAGEILPRPGAIAMIAAVVSIFAKEILYRYTVLVGRRINSPSVIANAWHHRSDALSSIGTLLGVGCAYFLGEKWRIADPIAALLVALFIFKIAYEMIRDGLGELLEQALPAETEQEIRDLITSSPEVTEPHNLRTRRIGSVIAIDVHIRVNPNMTVCHSHQLTIDIERRLKQRFGDNTLVNIHVEPQKEDVPCSDSKR